MRCSDGIDLGTMEQAEALFLRRRLVFKRARVMKCMGMGGL